MSDSKVDHVVPGEKWAFNQSVADVFDNMLKRSIPDYAGMRAAVLRVGSYVLNQIQREFSFPTAVVDLGCSRGGALADFAKKFQGQHRFVGVEVSPPMVKAAQDRFAGRSDVEILNLDLRRKYPLQTNTALTLAVLTLQFVPIEYRLDVVYKACKSTLPGGAIILVEKVLGANAQVNENFVENYHDIKRANGYTTEDIDRKKASLEGVLVPVTARWNEELLTKAGFNEPDCFWRQLNFAGWIAYRDGGSRLAA